jgi:hypothetical protein
MITHVQTSKINFKNTYFLSNLICSNMKIIASMIEYSFKTTFENDRNIGITESINSIDKIKEF